MAEPPARFAGVLRGLRTGAGLTQEELAEAAGLNSRTVSDLERGLATTPHKETVRLLADALQLGGSARIEFETAARGHAATGRVGGRGVAAATRMLPRDIASFTGRQHELAELAEAAAGAGGVVSIHAIGGMAGIGKTAFAVHAAHRLAGRFPGGQIFLPLHAHTPGQQPVDPADALASLLLTIGVPAGQIPADLQARTGLWRDRLAGRQLLLVLDDAAGSEQVRPLLPGAGGSLVLVTSRRRLTALEDAQTISLDALPPGEAAGLLVRLAVRPGLGSADPGVGEITRLCGCLPLAIGMLARQLYHHPAWSVAGRAAELAAAVDRLELLVTENLSVAAAFDLSYADLTPEQQRLFRRLALHPGTDIDRYAAAALDGTGLARRPPRPGGPVRPVPAHRAGPGPVPDARPDPRACPRPGQPPGPRRCPGAGHRAAARLLPAGRGPRSGSAGPRRPRPGARRRAGRCPGPGRPGTGAGVGPRRADQPAGLPGPRHRGRPARPGHRADRGPDRLAAIRRPVGRGHHPPGHRGAGRPEDRRPARPGPCPHRPRGRATHGRRLSGCGPGPAGGAGHLPGPRRPARPGPRPHPPGVHPAADRRPSGRGPGPAGGAGHLPGPRRPARPGPRSHPPGAHAADDRGLSGRGPGPAGGTGHLPGPQRPARSGPRPHLPGGRGNGSPATIRARPGTCRRR